MTDEDLAAFLGLSEAEAAIAIPTLTPERRATYERMAAAVADINMGIRPKGAIVCKRKWRHG